MKYFEYRREKREAKLAHQIEMDTMKEEDFRREKESLSEAHIDHDPGCDGCNHSAHKYDHDWD